MGLVSGDDDGRTKYQRIVISCRKGAQTWARSNVCSAYEPIFMHLSAEIPIHLFEGTFFDETRTQGTHIIFAAGDRTIPVFGAVKICSLALPKLLVKMQHIFFSSFWCKLWTDENEQMSWVSWDVKRRSSSEHHKIRGNEGNGKDFWHLAFHRIELSRCERQRVVSHSSNSSLKKQSKLKQSGEWPVLCATNGAR